MDKKQLLEFVTRGRFNNVCHWEDDHYQQYVKVDGSWVDKGPCKHDHDYEYQECTK